MFLYRFLLDKGTREEQQDSCGIFEKDGKVLLALSDGMGGHKGGAFASQTLISQAHESLFLDLNPKEMFEDIVFKTQKKIIHTVQKDKTLNPHTTCAFALIDDEKLYFAHIGDSRIYLFFDKELAYQSKDHSVVQMLVGLGDIKEEDMATHPDKNRVLRSIGIKENPKISYKEVERKSKDFTILLCSDGLWENLTKEQIGYYLFSYPLNVSLEQMVKKIKENSSKNIDNISVAVYKSSEV